MIFRKNTNPLFSSISSTSNLRKKSNKQFLEEFLHSVMQVEGKENMVVDGEGPSKVKKTRIHPFILDYSRHRSEELAQLSKEYEKQYTNYIPNDKPYVMRLDGVCFKTFTKVLSKPFDPRITNALLETCKDMVKFFKPSLGFCQSDEITLIFPAAIEAKLVHAGSEELEPSADEKWETVPTGSCHMYSGRVQKLSSVAAGYASTRFQYHLNQITDWTEKEKRVKNHECFFDCRVYAVSDEASAFDNLMWRHKYDCRRNVFSMIGRSFISHKSASDVPTREMMWHVAQNSHLKLNPEDRISVIDSLSDEMITDEIFQLYGARNVLGTFVKRDSCEIEANFNGKTITCIRTKIIPRTFDWPLSLISKELSCKIMMSKHWSEADNLLANSTDSSVAGLLADVHEKYENITTTLLEKKQDSSL